MSLIDFLSTLLVITILLKAYYQLKFNVNRYGGKAAVLRWIFGIYPVQVFSPIFKQPIDENERKLIVKANVSIYSFYVCAVGFFIAVAL